MKSHTSKNTDNIDKTPGLNLTGKWFHSFKEGEINWQGEVLHHDTHKDLCLVQTYDWVFGSAGGQRLVTITDMLSWRFYNTKEIMKHFTPYE